MKNLIKIIILALTATLILNAKYEILPKNEKLGRKSEVYANMLRIQMAPGIYHLNEASSSLAKNDALVERQFMKPENSLKFNKQKQNSPQLLSKDISKLIETEESLLRTFIIKYEGDLPPEVYAKQLVKNNRSVVYAEPFYVDQIMADPPNDPLVSNQELLYQIKAFEAWEIEKGNPDVVIGISDSGVMQNHPDLADGIKPNENDPINNMDDDNNGYTDDHEGCDLSKLDSPFSANNTFNANDGHGTEVAGIAVARTNNNTGIAGMAYNCSFFPMRVGENNAIVYGYESIKYAADRGIDVLNLSWGSVKNYSQIDQDIIDYAVARDVAIVASAGNNDNNILEVWYPAAYKGVLGVGQVDNFDRIVTNSTVLNISCDIMAPGVNLITTGNNGAYIDNTNGTSYSSPVVAGVVGLVRSKYPDLNALQALKHVSLSVDDISSANPITAYQNVLPGRINALKAVETDPFSRPGIFVDEYVFSVEGEIKNSFNVDDIVDLDIKAFNHLGADENVKFELSVAQDGNSGAVELIDSVVTLENIEQNSVVDINKFGFKITQQYINPVIMRLDITTEDGYSDFIKFQFYPYKPRKDFDNGTIAFSVSEDGSLGYTQISFDEYQGIGFEFKNYGNMLYYDSGLMISENVSNAISAYRNDFRTLQSFDSEDEPNTFIIDDEYALTGLKIGVEVKQKISFPELNTNTARFDIEVKNISDNDLELLSLGYYIDWDVSSNYKINKTTLFNDAEAFKGFEDGSFASQIAEYTEGEFPVFGAIAYSPDSDDVPQAAGLNYNFISDFNPGDQINVQNSGTIRQNENIEDISTFVGMQFANNIAPGETNDCIVCIGGAETKELLAQYLFECVTNIVSVKENVETENNFEVYPNPAKHAVNINLSNIDAGTAEYKIIDMQGKTILQGIPFNVSTGMYSQKIDLNDISKGMYIIEFKNNDKTYSKKIIIE